MNDDKEKHTKITMSFNIVIREDEFQLIGKLLMTRSLQFGIDVADARVDLCNLCDFPCRRRHRSTWSRICTSVPWITQQHMCFTRETPLNPHMPHVFNTRSIASLSVARGYDHSRERRLVHLQFWQHYCRDVVSSRRGNIGRDVYPVTVQ